MAGTFTHWLIVHKAVERLVQQTERHALADLLVRQKHWAYIGAQGPDYPYVGFIRQKTGKNWADAMHYDRTGDLTRQLGVHVHRVMQPESGRTTEEWETVLAWYLGYISHVLADVIIHPVVEATVGLYQENKREHARCESVQDSLLNLEVRGEVIAYGQFLARFHAVGADRELPRVIAMCWHGALGEIYREQWTEGFPFVYDWHAHFLDAVHVKGDPPALFRHVGESFGITYPLPDLIPPEEVEMYYEKVRLPGHRGTLRFAEVFQRTLEIVADQWWKVFREFSGPIAVDIKIEMVRNWDLDTGVDTGDVSHGPTFWPS